MSDNKKPMSISEMEQKQHAEKLKAREANQKSNPIAQKHADHPNKKLGGYPKGEAHEVVEGSNSPKPKAAHKEEKKDEKKHK